MTQFFWLFFSFQISANSLLLCYKDADCELRPVSCCQCSQGGKLKAAHKNTPKPDCADKICPQVISKDKSCLAKSVVCLKGSCNSVFDRVR